MKLGQVDKDDKSFDEIQIKLHFEIGKLRNQLIKLYRNFELIVHLYEKQLQALIVHIEPSISKEKLLNYLRKIQSYIDHEVRITRV